jgi:soluble lytic murein transglycosylase
MKPNQKLSIFLMCLFLFLTFTFLGQKEYNQHLVSYLKIHNEDKAIKEISKFLIKNSTTIEKNEIHDIASLIYNEAGRYGMDYRLILAMIKVESNFRHDAVSSMGARGLMQIKPTPARYMAGKIGLKWQGTKTLDDPDKNVKIGLCLLSELLEDFDSIDLALHAYHVGPTRLKEMLSADTKLNKGFLRLVLKEYEKNKATLPSPR